MSLIKLLYRVIKSAGAPRESDSERDGFLSYSAETHAFSHGVYHGLTTLRPWASTLPDNDDVRAEPHYYKGAYVIGTLLQWTGVFVLGYIGIMF